MKPMAWVRRICVLVAGTLLLAGCSSEKPVDSGVESGLSDAPVIGMSFDSFIIERWQRDRDVFVSAAQAMGAEVNVQNANGDIEEQIKQIDYLIQKRVDALVIISIDSYALSDIVQKAKEAGIYVVAYDRLIMNANVDLYISFDNERMGEYMGNALAEKLPAGSRILNICGSRADQNVTQANRGFDSVVDRSGLEVVRTVYADGWLAEVAYREVNAAIADGLAFDGIRCGNDDLASQAFVALSEHRLAGKVQLVGQDADLAACQRIVEGTQLMTVYKPVEKLAKQAAEQTMRLIAGEKPETFATIFDGKYRVPFRKLTPIPVTINNIDAEIIEGGFHQREQVYLNVK